MYKKIAFWVVVAIFIAGLILGYFYFVNLKKENDDVLGAIPSDCRLLLEINGSKKLMSQINFDEKFGKIDTSRNVINGLVAQVKIIESFFSNDEKVRLLFKEEPFYAADLGSTSLHEFVFLTSNSLAGIELKKLTTFQNSTKQRFEGANGNEFWSLNQGNKIIYISIQQGAFIVCENKANLEKILSAQKTLKDDQYFKKLQSQLSKNKSTRIYINTKDKLAHFSAFFLSNGFFNKLTSVTRANWLVADLEVGKGRIDFDGYLQSDSTRFHQIFAKQSPIQFGFVEILPENIQHFAGIGLSDCSRFFSSYKESSVQENSSDSLSETLKKGTAHLRTYLSGEMVCFNLSISNTLIRDYAMFKIHNAEEVKKCLNEISDSLLTISADTSQVLVADSVYCIKNTGLVNYLSAGFMNLPSCYFFIHSEYLICSSGIKEVKDLKKSLTYEKKLTDNLNYKKLMQSNLNEASTVFLYSVFPDSINEFMNRITDSKLKISEAFENLSYGSSCLAFQFTPYKDNFIFQGSIIKNEHEEHAPTTVWLTTLEAPVAAGPFIVLNHKSRKEEILVQDVHHQIYLINDSGKVLWKKKIEDKILGSVYQVDYFQNEKLQMYFNTSAKLHLIDRNGEEVEGFPKEPDLPFSNGITLLKNTMIEKLKIAYVSSDFNTHVSNISGKPNQNFVPLQINDTVINPVEFIDWSGKVYLMIKDGMGVVTVSNARGDKLFTTDSYFKNSDFPYHFTNEKYPDQLTIYAYKIYDREIIVQAKKGTSVVAKLEDDFEKPYYRFLKINEDDLPDLILLENNLLRVYEGTGSKLSELEFKRRLFPQLLQFVLNDENVFAVRDDEDNLFFIEADWQSFKDVQVRCNHKPVALQKNKLVLAYNEFIKCLLIDR